MQQLSAVFDQWSQARISLGRLDELLATPSATPLAAEPVDPGPVDRRRRARGRALRLLAPTRPRRCAASTCASAPASASRSSARPAPASRRSSSSSPASTTRRPAASLVDGHDLRDVDLHALPPPASATCPRSRSCSPARSARTSPTGDRTRPTSRSSAPPGPSAPTTSCARCPTGYETPVAETGRSLSAGQRQLLCLARAQLVDPTILILDEATSNLDLATEAEVQRAMNLASQGRTTLLIAHRLQTARNADAHRASSTRAASSRTAPTTSSSPPAAATPSCGTPSTRPAGRRARCRSPATDDSGGPDGRRALAGDRRGQRRARAARARTAGSAGS